MRMANVRWMAAPALLVALAGCEGLLNDDGFQRDELAAAQTRWQGKSIASYSYVLELQCPECGSVAEQGLPVRITVQNGAAVSRVYESEDPTERVTAPAAVFGPFDTVEELFGVVQRGIDRDADVLQVAYDPSYGYPSRVAMDPDGRDPDDHVTFRVTGFTPAGAAP